MRKYEQANRNRTRNHKYFFKWANPGLFSVYFRLFNMLQLKFKFKLLKA